MHNQQDTRSFNVVIVNAGTSDPSSTQMLAGRIADRAFSVAAEHGHEVKVRTVNLRGLANDITSALVSNFISPELQEALDLMRDADGVIASTPVYKAGPSGLFSEFFQILDNDLLIGTPVVLAGTGGSPRHSLVIDDQLRGVFAYLRTLTAPTAVYASPEDWQESGFGSRIDRAATELVLLMQSGLRAQLRGEVWGHYQHSLGSAGGAETEINLDTDLMRLATGG
ncbi:MAG: NADH-dependent FMN reductase [Leucobacter sp.]|jgi:FMN reductase|nr:NADH-dependent FMN reductase [Leucobacter sp.]